MLAEGTSIIYVTYRSQLSMLTLAGKYDVSALLKSRATRYIHYEVCRRKGYGQRGES